MRSRILWAVVPLIVAGCLSARPSSPPPAAPSDPTPVATPDTVTPQELETALLRIDPALDLRPFHDLDGLGVYPLPSFVNQAPFRTPRIWHVLVFASDADRIATQPCFSENSIQCRGHDLVWDGSTHSEWIGARNVIVEVEVPGGPFGSVEPWTDPEDFLAAVRAAVAGL